MKRILGIISWLAAIVAFLQSQARSTIEGGQNATSAGGNGTGRGRTATRPADIPAAGWKDILKRTLREVKDDNITTVAAAMTYYGLLALFPALIAVVSVYGLLFDANDVSRQLAEISTLLPTSAAEIVTEQVEAIVSTSDAALGFGLIISIVAALWTVSSGVSALIKAINLAYDETENRSFVKLRLVALGLTVGLVVFVVGAIFVITALPSAMDAMGMTAGAVNLTSILRWPGLGLILVLALAVLYRIGPNRDAAKWRWVSWGAVIAAVTWLLASLLLNVYVANFGSYNETYGALGGVVVLMLWMFVSALIVLVGAELDAELEAQTKWDTTTGPPEPMGEREAVKADRLGKRADKVDL